MLLRNLRLQRFRNHIDSLFEFGSGSNVLLGDNGHGKTNVIEAISYLCLTKSFYAGSDANVLNFESDAFEIEGTLVSEHGKEYRVHVAYSKDQTEKVFIINRRRIEPFSSVIGKFPVVICSPEHSPVTVRGPSERRKFVDFVVSQSSSVYFENLLEYRRVLRQRNKILMDAKTGKNDVTRLLEPWDEQLISRGGFLMQKRMEFVVEFQKFISPAYHRLVGEGEEPTIGYEPAGPNAVDRDIQEGLRFQIKEMAAEERRFGTTLVGPHRDEFALKINGLDLRKFASQGQHKTFLIALKMGEFFYLKERCQETPILLLDDIFSELDEHRSSRLLDFVGTLNQAFITSTSPGLFGKGMLENGQNRVFRIANGKIAA